MGDKRLADRRYREYAKLLLDHSLRMQAGERVLIQTEPAGVAFAEVIAQEVVRAGGHPLFWLTSARVGSTRLVEGSHAQLDFVHPAELAFSQSDCRIVIDAPDGQGFPSFSPERLIRRRRVVAQAFEPLQALRWVIALQPTHHLAKCLGVSFSRCEELIFQATTGTDWQAVDAKADTLKRVFDGHSRVRIVAEGTDISFAIDGRPMKKCTGRHNLPGGEVYLSPVTESVEGALSFIDPQTTGAGVIRRMQMRFHEGDVVDFSAAEGQELLEATLGIDSGSRRIGEFGIGLSPLMDRLTGNVLLDEKLEGTIHLALGRAFPEIGGTNESAIHWDMVLDLRRGGEVWLDDELICRDGEWLPLAGLNAFCEAVAISRRGA